jgi:hypothetical protein
VAVRFRWINACYSLGSRVDWKWKFLENPQSGIRIYCNWTRLTVESAMIAISAETRAFGFKRYDLSTCRLAFSLVLPFLPQFWLRPSQALLRVACNSGMRYSISLGFSHQIRDVTGNISLDSNKTICQAGKGVLPRVLMT